MQADASIAHQTSQGRSQYRVKIGGAEAQRVATLFPALGSPPQAGRGAGPGEVRWLHVRYRAKALIFDGNGYISFNVNKKNDFWNWTHAAYGGHAIPAQVLFTVQKGAPWQAEVLTHPSAASANAVPEAEAEPGAFDPSDDSDARLRVMRAIALRRGQPAFRGQLLQAYGRACAISGCDVVEALEAAHIAPYRGEHTHHVTNGLLLRADLHTLFDRRLLAIDGSTWRIVLSASLGGSHYGGLAGQRLRLPADAKHHPSALGLLRHREECGF